MNPIFDMLDGLLADAERRMPMVAHARTTDPQTSHAAAASVGKVKALQRVIVVLFEMHGPMTDTLLVDRYYALQGFLATPQNLRSRRAELVKLGKVRDTGQREVGPSGRKFVVWGLTK